MLKQSRHLILVVGLLVQFLLHGCGPSASGPGAAPSSGGFDRSVIQVVYTRHARCRMACRHISNEDIRDIIDRGELNERKSNPNDHPCPTYALQGYTHGGHHLRVIFAQCDRVTKVVTCYDLEHEFVCDCN